MTKPPIDELLSKETRALTPQMSGDLLAEIKRLASERYAQLFGSDGDFEKLWRSAFFIDENPNGQATRKSGPLVELGAKVRFQLAKDEKH